MHGDLELACIKAGFVSGGTKLSRPEQPAEVGGVATQSPGPWHENSPSLTSYTHTHTNCWENESMLSDRQ